MFVSDPNTRQQWSQWTLVGDEPPQKLSSEGSKDGAAKLTAAVFVAKSDDMATVQSPLVRLLRSVALLLMSTASAGC